MSARVGSIGDNHTGGWYSYRASKTALNQLNKCVALGVRTPSCASCMHAFLLLLLLLPFKPRPCRPPPLHTHTQPAATRATPVCRHFPSPSPLGP